MFHPKLGQDKVEYTQTLPSQLDIQLFVNISSIRIYFDIEHMQRNSYSLLN